MPFPESSRVLYQHNPLAEVICQVQFPTILRIATELPSEFQQQIREFYPVFRQELGIPAMPPNVSQLLANLPINLQSGPVYFFDSESGSRTVVLTREALSITERKYTQWEDLRTEIEMLRGALQKIYAPSFYTRIGLRYQDVFNLAELDLQGSKWNQLLHPAIAGLLGAEDEIQGAVTGIGGAAEIAIAEVADAAVRVQYGLTQTPLNEAVSFALDADFYTNQRSPYERVTDILDIFNHLAGNLFRWAITERLRDALRPTPLAQQ